MERVGRGKSHGQKTSYEKLLSFKKYFKCEISYHKQKILSHLRDPFTPQPLGNVP